MTTIAYRDDVLAADTQITCGKVIDGYAPKIFRIGSILYGTAGCSGVGDKFRTWLQGGMQGEPPTMKDGDRDADALVFPGDNRVVWRYGSVWASHRAPFFAYGSGAEFAMGAMAMGATAEEAVHAAIRFDTASGGDVTVLRRHEQALRLVA